MTTSASFEVDVAPEDAISFAELSGDWNPLHTDPDHAKRTTYRRPVLHGAFSAGLVSRMAGMYIPGTDCLLHGMRLRFVRPIVPPVRLVVQGTVAADDGRLGRVDVTISDAASGACHVIGAYEFSRHEVDESRTRPAANAVTPVENTDDVILVTGATGGLGRAVVQQLGSRALGVSRTASPGLLEVSDLELADQYLDQRRLSGIVHCAWPAPDNQRLTQLSNVEGAVEHNLAAPLRQMLSLAQLLQSRGTSDAMLVLIGSAFASPGRHNYRMPLYSLAKSLISPLARILALELSGTLHRCVAVSFDVIDGGMNKRLSPAIRAMHADRVPSGTLPSMNEVAGQIAWVLDNRSFLVSGATIDLTGAAIP